jgi:hypothetical protein
MRTRVCAEVLPDAARAHAEVVARTPPADIFVRNSYARAANVFWIAGGTLGAASIGMFVWQR